MKKWGALGLAMQMSWTLLFSLLIPLFAGIWLDSKFGTTPLFILIGALVGILAATVGVARMAIRMFPLVEQEPSDQPTDSDGEEEPE
jgi:ATP synthase protein I